MDTGKPTSTPIQLAAASSAVEEKKTSLDRSWEPALPNDLLRNTLCGYLTLFERDKLVNASEQFAALPEYQDAAAELASQANQLRWFVARGKQAQAQFMRKQDSDLVFFKGEVRDYSGRVFKNISALQYAAWALDRHMWTMLLADLKEDQIEIALEQLEELETNGTEHGAQYNFGLIAALQKHVNYLNTQGTPDFSWAEADRLWVEGVGGAQREVPAHVVHEYCRPDRAFDPLPTFKERVLSRGMAFDNWVSGRTDSWFPLVSGRGPSFGFAVYRGVLAREGAGEGTAAEEASEDLAAIAALCQVRTQELKDLKTDLKAKLNLRALPTVSLAPRPGS